MGQETTGGLAKAMRTVPVVPDVAERVARRAAPGAWIVDFTNPVGIVTRVLLDAGHRAVGLCNVAIGFQRRFATMLGVAPVRVTLDHIGLNHLTAPELAGLIAHVSAYEQLAVEAALLGGRERVYRALLAHPLVGQHSLTEGLRPGGYLPRRGRSTGRDGRAQRVGANRALDVDAPPGQRHIRAAAGRHRRARCRRGGVRGRHQLRRAYARRAHRTIPVARPDKR